MHFWWMQGVWDAEAHVGLALFPSTKGKGDVQRGTSSSFLSDLNVSLVVMYFDLSDFSIVHLPSHTNCFHPSIDSSRQLNYTEDIAKWDECVQTDHPLPISTEQF
jgi:hypothetical protein